MRKSKAFDDDVASDGCDNCFSNVLTISGHGRVNNHGLEVAHNQRQPKQLSSSTPLPSYNPSTPQYADAGYDLPSSTPAPPAYNPSTAGMMMMMMIIVS